MILPAVALLLLGASPGCPAPSSTPHWQAAWMAAPFPAIRKLSATDERDFVAQEVRQTVRLGAAGGRIRLRLTNELGTVTVPFAGVTVALIGSDGRPGAAIPVSFSGRPGATIPVGAPLVSDPIALPVTAFADLSVSVRYDRPAVPAAHLLQVELSPAGSTDPAAIRKVRAPGLAAAVEVERTSVQPVVVAIGDSITEGFASTPGAHLSWPEQLSRLDAARGLTILNAGISGNRVLVDGAGANALARFDRDVLAVPGVTHVIVMEGVNDIGNAARDGAVTAGDLIAAYRQMIDRAHTRGVRAIGATITPYGGAVYFNAAGEATRQQVNAWIMAPGNFDGSIDFAAAVADPADPTRIAAAFDPGDHLHPNDAGYTTMAAAAAASAARNFAACPVRSGRSPR